MMSRGASKAYTRLRGQDKAKGFIAMWVHSELQVEG